MSRDILDLIDSTLDDDAMRWAPEAPDPTPAPHTVDFTQVLAETPDETPEWTFYTFIREGRTDDS